MKSKRVLLSLSVILLILIGWAALTKAGYIPNFFNIEFLCPDNSKPIKHDIIPFETDTVEEIDYKPVIYLYPETETNVNVKLNYRGKLTVSYPEYGSGWTVTAFPEGKIINHTDQKEYSYLFWEGKDESAHYDLSTGFIVERSEMVQFLQEKLSMIGLTPNEYNEFIVYWLPMVQENKYSLVHFATQEEYADRVGLDISPKPNSILRVYLVFQAVDHSDIEIKPQELEPFIRKGFTVVEWGGTLIKKKESV
jgi:hypothetical protein